MSIIDRFRLDGQVAVVTGGGRGIGEGLALGLAEAGADVVVAARRTDEIEAVAERIRTETGRRALAITTDVMDIEQVRALAERTVEEMGKLTCWVSNAGGADDRVPRTLLEMPERQWDFQLDLNLKAVWTGAQAAAAVMADGEGTIINISSIAANRASPYNGPYAVAKSGVNNLTQTLAIELAPRQIRVNGVSPGPIPTEVFLEFTGQTEDDIPEMGKKLDIPLGRVGMPEDISPAVVYLASDASSWMTGQTIVVSGGR